MEIDKTMNLKFLIIQTKKLLFNFVYFHSRSFLFLNIQENNFFL
jgi:hypothetical protein